MTLAALLSNVHSGCLAASVVFFSTRGGGLSLHVWLIIIVLSITAPVTTIVLARAALFRRRQAGDSLPPPLRGRQ
jgi:multicomponent K+:H+ antiporter subunit G